LLPTPIRAAVVDDDFMIAKLHGKLIESLPDYQWIGTAHNYNETICLLKELRPDLLLLDVYMPDQSGIEVLRSIRSQNSPCDVILVTAAKELEVVEEGFRLGIFDYLIKPFDLNRLKKSLEKYLQFRMRLTKSNPDRIDQMMVDDLKKLRSVTHSTPPGQQKGIDLRTLERIQECLADAKGFLSAEEVAKLAGVSRSTARHYLVYMVEEQLAEEQLAYGTVGRPQRLYRMNK
jgi:response regulator of citrate/malate metabolism